MGYIRAHVTIRNRHEPLSQSGRKRSISFAFQVTLALYAAIGGHRVQDSQSHTMADDDGFPSIGSAADSILGEDDYEIAHKVSKELIRSENTAAGQREN